MHRYTKECQRLAENYQKLGRGQEEFSYMFQREDGPDNTLILGFLSPGL